MFEEISREDVREPAPARAITVFSREGGDIVIRQGRAAGAEEPCIILSREQAGVLVEAIRRAIGSEK